MTNSCFFIGHRDAPDSLIPELEALVERHITEYGVTVFTVGQYGRFDALAAGAVKRAKSGFVPAQGFLLGRASNSCKIE